MDEPEARLLDALLVEHMRRLTPAQRLELGASLVAVALELRRAGGAAVHGA